MEGSFKNCLACLVCDEDAESQNQNWTLICLTKLSLVPFAYCISSCPFILNNQSFCETARNSLPLQSHQDDHPLIPSEPPWDSGRLTVPGNTFTCKDAMSILSEKRTLASLTYKVVFTIKQYMVIHVYTHLVIVFISKYWINKINVIIQHTRREINYIVQLTF